MQNDIKSLVDRFEEKLRQELLSEEEIIYYINLASQALENRAVLLQENLEDSKMGYYE